MWLVKLLFLWCYLYANVKNEDAPEIESTPVIYGLHGIEVAFEEEPKNLSCWVHNVINGSIDVKWYKREDTEDVEYKESFWMPIDEKETHFKRISIYDGKSKVQSILMIEEVDEEDAKYFYKCEIQHANEPKSFMTKLIIPKMEPVLVTMSEKHQSPHYDFIGHCYVVAFPKPTRVRWLVNKWELKNSTIFQIELERIDQYAAKSTLKIVRGYYSPYHKYLCKTSYYDYFVLSTLGRKIVAIICTVIAFVVAFERRHGNLRLW